MSDMFFSEAGLERDRYGRPLIIPRGETERVPYFRASGMSETLTDTSYITKWQMRGLAKGLSGSRDLINMINAETYTSGFTSDKRENSQAGARIDAHVNEAMRRGGTAEKADYGTAVHSLTEPGSEGISIEDSLTDDVNACLKLWADAGVEHLSTETFTACDEIKTAGTFDNLSFVPGYGIVITDKKTSASPHADYAVQLGIYANSDVYDEYTDNRATMRGYIAGLGWDPNLWNPHVGFIWWIKNGRAQARILDLDAGWEYAKLAYKIKTDFRKWGVAKDVTKSLIDAAAKDGLQREVKLFQTTNTAKVVDTEPDFFW